MKPFDTTTTDRLARLERPDPIDQTDAWQVGEAERPLRTDAESKPGSGEYLSEIPANKADDEDVVISTKRPMPTPANTDVFAIETFLTVLKAEPETPEDVLAMPGLGVLFEYCQTVAAIDGLKRGLVRE